MGRVKDRFNAEPLDDEKRQIMSLLETMTSPQRFLKRVAVKSAGKITFVNIADVDWIEAEENYVQLHAGRASHLLHATLSALTKLLDPEIFLPIHRSIVININRVQALQPAGHGEYVVTMESGIRLRSGRTYHEKLKALAANPF
jgi:two-component system, LytTR family, response regulator